jgi:hypothetical protein
VHNQNGADVIIIVKICLDLPEISMYASSYHIMSMATSQKF